MRIQLRWVHGCAVHACGRFARSRSPRAASGAQLRGSRGCGLAGVEEVWAFGIVRTGGGRNALTPVLP